MCEDKGDVWSGKTKEHEIPNARVVKEYDVVPYRPTTGKFGLENHHGVMNEWAKQNVPGYTAFVNVSPTVALSVDNHKLTKEIFREWSRENYGRPVGAKIEWAKMSPQQIQ